MMNSTIHVRNKRYKLCTNGPENAGGGAPSNSLYVARTNLRSKPDKDISAKENYVLIDLINMHVNTPKKILANQI